jgi:CheY-like chemotaxis protein
MQAKTAKPRCVVLIVEDEPLVRVTGANLLSEAEFEVLEARNGDEALRILAAVRQIEEVVNQQTMSRKARTPPHVAQSKAETMALCRPR